MGACAVPAKSPTSSSTTQVDQLKLAYHELEGGRFAIIADFEEPSQMEMFQLVSTNKDSKLLLDKKHGRAETGATCLATTLADPNDEIVVSNINSHHWYLKRDWRPYNLLMLSVFSPMPNETLDLTIVTGSGGSRQSLHTPSTLDRGWNLLRLDLAELGERLPLDDVQELRMRVEGRGSPQPFYFDDILLVDSSTPLLGDVKGPIGDLYAVQAGRRLVIGSSGRFELTFAHGQIIQWFNLAADPNRLVNLVEGTSLGPYPNALEDHHEAIPGDRKRALAIRQQIVELNRVRAVVESEWLGDSNSEFGNSRYRWKYTIYPTGQVYVELSCEKVEDLSRGMFLALSAPKPEDIEITSSRASAPTTGDPDALWMTIRVHSVDAAILFVPAIGNQSAEIESVPDPEHRRIIIRANPIRPLEQPMLAAHLYLTTNSGLSNSDEERRARDYQNSIPLRFEVGKAATNSITVARKDGFVATTGCYTIDADGGRARITVDGASHRLSTPAFHIRQTSGASAWVYVNHLILDRVERTEEGDVIFQIPRDISVPTEIEVLTRGGSVPLTHSGK